MRIGEQIIEHLTKQGLFVSAEVHYTKVSEREYDKGFRDRTIWAIHIHDDEDSQPVATGIASQLKLAVEDAIEVWTQKRPDDLIPPFPKETE